MNGHNDNDICRICIESMKMIPQDVRSNLGGGEASRPHVISLTCCDDSQRTWQPKAAWAWWANRAHSGGLRRDCPPTSPRRHGHVDPLDL